MRILRVAQDIHPDVLGGGAYHAHAMSRDQATMGHDVRVLTISPQATVSSTERRDGYELRRYRPLAAPFGMGISIDLADVLRDSDDFDVVHAHSHVYYASNVAAALGTFTETPLAVTCHGLHSQSIPHWVSKMHLGTVGSLTYRLADIVFCYTDSERARLRELGVDGPIAVVSNGIDVERFSPEGSVYEPMERRDGPTLLFVGRLEPGKRPDVALTVVEQVRTAFPDVTLYVCGDGERRGDIERAAVQQGIEEHVEFLGTVPYEDMPSLYRGADVFLLPSLTEGFPRTIMESLGCETPVVASALDQTTSLLERTGYAVEAGDVEQFAAAVEALLDEEAERRRLGRRGREIVSSEYTWRETVAETTSRLEQLVEDDA